MPQPQIDYEVYKSRTVSQKGTFMYASNGQKEELETKRSLGTVPSLLLVFTPHSSFLVKATKKTNERRKERKECTLNLPLLSVHPYILISHKFHSGKQTIPNNLYLEHISFTTQLLLPSTSSTCQDRIINQRKRNTRWYSQSFSHRMGCMSASWRS